MKAALGTEPDLKDHFMYVLLLNKIIIWLKHVFVDESYSSARSRKFLININSIMKLIILKPNSKFYIVWRLQ